MIYERLIQRPPNGSHGGYGRHFLSRRALLVAVLLAGNVAASRAQAQLAVSDMLSLKRFDTRAQLEMSPDGQWVAYTIHDGSRHVRVGDASVGDLAALTTSGNPIEQVDCDVWVTNTTTGDTRNVTGGAGSSWGPVWSPDGAQLAFYSDRDSVLRVWIWDRTSDRLRRASAAQVRPLKVSGNLLRWLPSGRTLLVAMASNSAAVPLVTGLGTDSAALAPRVYQFSPRFASDSLGRAGGDEARGTVSAARYPRRDLALMDVASGGVTRLVVGQRIVGWWLAANGATVTYTVDKGREISPTLSGRGLRDVVTLDLATRGMTVVAADVVVGVYGLLSFSPDGSTIAYLASAIGTNRIDCFVAAVKGKARNVTPGAHVPFDGSLRAPVWDQSGHALYLSGTSGLLRVGIGAGAGDRDTLSVVAAIRGERVSWIVTTSDPGQYWSSDDGQSLIILTRDSAASAAAVYRVDVRRSAASQWYHGRPQIGNPWSGSATTARVVGSAGATQMLFVAEDLQHPADLWVTTASGRPRQLTHLNPAIDRVPLPSARLIDWTDSSGAHLRGVLMLPAGYVEGRRYPLLVYQYPSEYKSWRVNSFGGDAAAELLNMHLFTTRGYAVLLPDVPQDIPDTTIMRATWRAVAGGIDRVIALGIADPDRLGIMGHSFGGYGVVSTIVSTHRFRAAVALSGGYYNFPGQFLQLEPDGSFVYTRIGTTNLGGSLWDRSATYVANSPVFFLDRVTTPLLLIDGGSDELTSPQQSEQVFTGLRYLRREVEYVLYPGEGHNYLEWTRAHQLDVVTRILDWLDQHLHARRVTS